ncbi:MAG: hypothetical protein PHR77_21030 [Kiritimatiellae bacterium]|nr:hypothetical protein [Kiritimatiellia bacterium]MDD5521249.1 hypothetical protein [Kiritimatiellia bacterium]
MGTGRKFNKKPKTRPKKDGADRKRKQKVQLRRLIALGMPEEVANKLNPKVVRDILKYPARVNTAIKVFTGGKKKKK